jgi:hypothetical protein
MTGNYCDSFGECSLVVGLDLERGISIGSPALFQPLPLPKTTKNNGKSSQFPAIIQNLDYGETAEKIPVMGRIIYKEYLRHY